MASKIFKGDMPELMENILNNLKNEIYSLHSCALVSRHWCKISIPILWQDPFSLDRSSRPSFIFNYFSSLCKDEKFVLKKYGINVKSFKTLFEYARFIKVLNLSCIKYKVERLTNRKLDNPSKNYIINLFIKLFIESGAILHKLYFPDYEINPENFILLEQNDQFFSRLQHLTLDIEPRLNPESTATLLKILTKNATKISALKLEKFHSNYEIKLFHTLICMIESQEKLKLINLSGDFSTKFNGFVSALECQKNSLKEVIIDCCAYSAEFELLKNFKYLETLRINYCDRKLIKSIENKISALEVVDVEIDAPTIVHILEKSGTLLQRLKFESEIDILNENLLLEALKSFCPNIKYLYISRIMFSIQFLELIGSLHKLQFLSFWCLDDDEPEEKLKLRVLQFAKILPLTLKYLDLGDNDWTETYLDILLNHCNASLNNLLIYDIYNEKNTKAIVEFCKRNKTLNYVGVDQFWNLDDDIKKQVEGHVTFVPAGKVMIKF
ncbi:hypothetical protein F8M41_013525 [Gigaspora margarita]|uniref:F-box domain-containing protein n=1 Tax=Gigaspora margarita TaxID=4874 RepID=A0A8H4AS62_GIGMA|nr:hypothetical protein F8M41_013525 [Gigaspora margarita]